MTTFKIVLLVYGVLLLAGGIMGYIKAHSMPSLIMGAISGILIFISMYVLNSNMKTGIILASLTSAVLTAVFLMRFLKTQSFMPSGMLLALSALVFIICIIQFWSLKPPA